MANRGTDIDITDLVPEDLRVIHEGDRLRFAKQVLLFVGVVCVMVFAAYVVYPNNQALASIFELIKIGFLPLITLVISFTFPRAIADGRAVPAGGSGGGWGAARYREPPAEASARAMSSR